MSPSSAKASPLSPVSRAALERLVEILRPELAPENAALLKLLVTLAGGDAAEERAREPSVAASLGATAWDQLRITVVDGHTVRIGCGNRVVRRTYRDLGLHAAHSRNPTRKWAMLVAICEGHGTFRWRDFGSFGAACQAVSVLRGKLREAIGLPGDPFHDWDGGWRARFFASSELGAE